MLRVDTRCSRFAALSSIATLVACGPASPSVETLDELELGDRTARIIWLRDAPDTASARINVVLTDRAGERTVYEAVIATASGTITADNVRAEVDRSSELLLCLNSDHQDDVSVRINPVTNTIIESDKPCAPVILGPERRPRRWHS